MLPFESVKRTVLVKRPAESSPKFGMNPADRSVAEIISYGVVNIDKPRGPTSHQVTDYAKKILGISKAGHSGTLDPKVTGVLPVALGRGTRVVQSLLIAGKEYVALMHLHKPVPEDRIRAVCAQFTGSIRQLPPVRSAVKRQVRSRNIYYFDIIEIDGQDVLFRVGTQAGTYIRKLIHDIGVRLGSGAHMAELRRTKAGPFGESTLATLQDIADALHLFRTEGNEKYIRKVIQPLENGVSHVPKIWILDTTVDSLCHGASLKVPGIAKIHSGIENGAMVAIMTLKDEIVALGTAKLSSEEIVAREHGLAAATDKVFMLPGTYPKIEKRE